MPEKEVEDKCNLVVIYLSPNFNFNDELLVKIKNWEGLGSHPKPKYTDNHEATPGINQKHKLNAGSQQTIRGTLSR